MCQPQYEVCSPEPLFPLLKSRVCYCTLVILVLGMQKGQEFKVILSHKVSKEASLGYLRHYLEGKKGGGGREGGGLEGTGM